MIKRIIALAIGITILVSVMLWDWICWKLKRS